MGENLNIKKLSFVSFEINNGVYKAYLNISDFISIKNNQEIILNNAVAIYNKYVDEMHNLIKDINNFRLKRSLIPAHYIWNIGDKIFKLKKDLENISLQIDSLYKHLERDLNVKKSWLEKVIIFRRHIPFVNIIPVSLNWGKCSKRPGYIANKLRNNYYNEKKIKYGY